MNMPSEIALLQSLIAQPVLEDKLSQEKRLKTEIARMREHASVVSEGKGTLVCDGPFGRCVVAQKEATLLDLARKKVLRNEPFKSHLYAVHRALCWAVLGMVENRFGAMQLQQSASASAPPDASTLAP